MIDVFVSAMIFAFIYAVITAWRGQNFNVNSERESQEERRREALKARAVDQDKKLRLDRDNGALGGENVDTKTLVVGQDVYMVKPPYPFWFCIDEGKVVKVTPEGVDVQVVDRQTPDAAYCQRKDRGDKAIKITPSRVEVKVADLQTADLIRFDTSGKETDVSRRNRLGFGPSPDDKFYTSLWQSAPEFGPWHLDDMPFAERTALIEQKAQRFRKWRSMDCEHRQIGEHYYIEKCPNCGCDNPNYNPTAAKDRLQGKLHK